MPMHLRLFGAEGLIAKTLLLGFQDHLMNRCFTVGSSVAEAPILMCLCLDSN
jgi:hypothetical protein